MDLLPKSPYLDHIADCWREGLLSPAIVWAPNPAFNCSISGLIVPGDIGQQSSPLLPQEVVSVGPIRSPHQSPRKRSPTRRIRGSMALERKFNPSPTPD